MYDIGQGRGGKCHDMLCNKLIRAITSVVTYSLWIQFLLILYLVTYLFSACYFDSYNVDFDFLSGITVIFCVFTFTLCTIGLSCEQVMTSCAMWQE